MHTYTHIYIHIYDDATVIYVEGRRERRKEEWKEGIIVQERRNKGGRESGKK